MIANTIDKHILSLVCSVFDAHSAVLFLPDEGGEEHKLCASFSLGEDIDEDCAIQAGKGLVGWIIHNRQPLLVPNFDQHQGKLGYYLADAEDGIKAFMGCPVPTGGALCVDSKRQYSFSDKDHKLLQLFAELVSRQQGACAQDLADDIPRYFAELGIIQDLRSRFKRWPEFLDNFLRTVADATRFDYCAFASLADPDQSYCLEAENRPLFLEGSAKRYLPLGSGLAGWVFRNEQPVFNGGEDTAIPSALFGRMPGIAPFQATICLPVLVNRTANGVLCLGSESPREIDESMRSFVRQAVDYLALYLENLYLKTRLQVEQARSAHSRSLDENEEERAYPPDSSASLHRDQES